MAENAEDQTNQRKEVRRGRGALAFSYRRGYRKYKPHVERSKRGIHPNNPDSVNVAESTVEQPISRTESLHTTRVVTVDAACGNDLAISSREPSSQKTEKRRICKYFKMDGSCYFGERCRFLHIQNDVANNKLNEGGHSEMAINRQPLRPIARPNVIILTKTDIGSEQQKQSRTSEITYIKRRFPESTVEDFDNRSVIRVVYNITYPEWPFDVSAIDLVFEVPVDYPCSLLIVNADSSLLPLPLVKHINNALAEYVQDRFSDAEKRNSYSCIGKALIRWLDHEIFTLFVDGLRKTKIFSDAEKDGISLASFEQITTSEHIEEERPLEVDNFAEPNVENESSTSSEPSSPHQISEPTKQPLSATIEARVEWDNTSGNIASLTIGEMVLNLRCRKCQAMSFMTCIPSRTTLAHCIKCSNGHSVNLQSNLVHENSRTIAILTPKGCAPVDCVLLSSKISFVCLNCNKEAIAENLIYGRPHKTWCFSCHKKCEFVIHSLRFHGNFNAIESEEQSATVKIKKANKKVRESTVIVEGQPLPQNGTCKHYKKSYRWFRFPCCGKLYPCDLCHNEKETDHEMKMGNRMVCGFCSKEQLYKRASQCMNCHENVTRVRSQFWEGGKGCRDQTVMSRNDTKKHKNSLAKTVSKKQANKLQIKQKTVKEND